MSKYAVDLEHPFHTSVKEYIVCLILFLVLYVLSYLLIIYLRVDVKSEQLYCGEQSDFIIFRISTWICTLTIATSLGAVLLIPLSIFSNEILLRYPRCFYFKWLNGSLVRNLWNSVFLLSNVCIFILLPFAYFLLESHAGSDSHGYSERYPVASRVGEALLMCLFLVAFWIVKVQAVLSIFSRNTDSISSLFWWYNQLPEVYSCLSLVGTCVLLVCTPYGLGKILFLVDQIVDKPKDVNKLRQTLNRLSCEVVLTQRRMACPRTGTYRNFNDAQDFDVIVAKSTALQNYLCARAELSAAKESRQWLCWIKYAAAVSTLSILVLFSVLLVISNVVQLVTGLRHLPDRDEEFELGRSSLTFLGTSGAVSEVVVTLFLMMTSLYGWSSIPLFRGLRPRRRQTPMKKIVLNSAGVLLLSSALPVLAKVLGITSFNLLGDYGKLDWLGNFALLLGYNILFTLLMGCSLSFTIGASVRRNWSDFGSGPGARRPSMAEKRIQTPKENGHCLNGIALLKM